MDEYINEFIKAMEWTENKTDKKFNYPFSINKNIDIDMENVISYISKDFSEFIDNSDFLPGRCFIVVRELSYVLFELKIKHTVTIGDIELNDGMYVGLSKQGLKKELNSGYQYDIDDRGEPIGKAANAHAWITLENGVIIDGTILASLNRKVSKEPLTLKEAIYHSKMNNPSIIRHIPFMTGFAYHYLVLTHPVDGHYDTYMQWYETFFGFMEHMKHI